MKKLLLVLFSLSVSAAFIYPQNLRKVEAAKAPVKEQINFPPLNKEYRVSATPFVESFESTAFPPAGWSVFTYGGFGWKRVTAGTILPNWTTTKSITTPSGGGSAVAYCTWSDSTFFNDQWLVTPLIQNVQPTDTLFFWMRNQISTFPDSIYIYYSDGTNYFRIGQVIYSGAFDTNWGKWYLPLSNSITTGSDIFLAFRELVLDNGANGGAISLDLVEIKGGVTYPASITINNTYSFNGNITTNDYRLIGMPGDQSTKINNVISGDQKKDWDAYDDNGNASDFLKEFDGSSVFNFIPGKGFWVLSKNPFTVQANNVKTVQLTNNAFIIDLHTLTGTISVFKIISNPFEKDVNWSDVQNLNGLGANDFLWDFNGVWSHATVMKPYKAYYYINVNNLTQLKIPYDFTSAKISKTNSSADTYTGKYVKLSVMQNEQEKSYIIAGFNSSASADYDKLDCLAPPGNFDRIRINIEDNNLSFPYKQLFVDYRPDINEGQSFDLNIKNASKESIKLTAGGLENFPGKEVYLFDENLNRFCNLKENNEISLSPIHQKNNFKLLIGSEDFINNIKNNFIPTEYNLAQNYPNPFNPSTLIKYQIPKSGLVELKVYNILGKEVKTLVKEIQDAGVHEVEFNGIDLSSGVYFYSLNAGSFSSTKKMIFMK